MSRINFIPRMHLRPPGESSPLASMRESGAATHNWQKIRHSMHTASQLANQMSTHRAQSARQEMFQQPMGKMHPFKVYQFPAHLRRFQPPDAWHRYKVRNGNIMRSTSSFGPYIYGTDRIASLGGGTVPPIYNNLFIATDQDIYTSTNFSIPSDGSLMEGEVIVPIDGREYFWWVSLIGFNGGFVPGIFFGLSNVNCLEVQTGAIGTDPWPNFPGPDPYHFPIAKAFFGVSYYSRTTPVMNVTQFQRDNFITHCGAYGASGEAVAPVEPRFMGEYDAATNYYQGDQVIVTGTDFVSFYINYPPISTAYPMYAGPILNISPAAHSPDPWLLLSQSPRVNTVLWATTPFDGTKSFLRKA